MSTALTSVNSLDSTGLLQTPIRKSDMEILNADQHEDGSSSTVVNKP